MTPMAVLLALLIQCVPSLLSFYFLKKHLAENRYYLFFVFNMILYELAFFTFSGSIPITGLSHGGLKGFLNIGYTLSSILSGLIITGLFIISRSWRSKYTS